MAKRYEVCLVHAHDLIHMLGPEKSLVAFFAMSQNFCLFTGRFMSPISAVPLVALSGFGLYEFGFPLVSIENTIQRKNCQKPAFILVSQYLFKLCDS